MPKGKKNRARWERRRRNGRPGRCAGLRGKEGRWSFEQRGGVIDDPQHGIDKEERQPGEPSCIYSANGCWTVREGEADIGQIGALQGKIGPLLHGGQPKVGRGRVCTRGKEQEGSGKRIQVGEEEECNYNLCKQRTPFGERRALRTDPAEGRMHARAGARWAGKYGRSKRRIRLFGDGKQGLFGTATSLVDALIRLRHLSDSLKKLAKTKPRTNQTSVFGILLSPTATISLGF
ncbi:hypothetical protein C8R43DRAFT_940598 [Mycena crocata]|nr:hypothetical protein C8R43DRAFT_940598 [Mycena crocata]